MTAVILASHFVALPLCVVGTMPATPHTVWAVLAMATLIAAATAAAGATCALATVFAYIRAVHEADE